VLEGSGRNPAAKRLPLGNLFSRIAGALVVLAVYPLVTPFISAIEGDPARAIANFHLLFNLGLACLLLPLLTPYARLLERLLPARATEELPGSPRYLPMVAPDEPMAQLLAAATREALRLTDILEQMLAGLRAALTTPSRRGIEDARHLDDRLDRINRAIKERLLAIDPRQMTNEDDDRAARILIFSINLEQAGDLIDRGLLDIVGRGVQRGTRFSSEGRADLIRQVDQLVDTLHQSTAVFLNGDVEGARALASKKEVFRRLDDEAFAAHFDRVRAGKIETIESSALHLDALRDLKRISSHIIEASAYPILKQRGELLPTRLKIAQ
jgi:phosphate:Na+ symporter